jgi:hypothetical protein
LPPDGLRSGMGKIKDCAAPFQLTCNMVDFRKQRAAGVDDKEYCSDQNDGRHHG